MHGRTRPRSPTKLEHHDAPGDTLHLAQAGDWIGPMVVRQDSHRGIKGLIAKRVARHGAG
jgi:hypothetical protein